MIVYEYYFGSWNYDILIEEVFNVYFVIKYLF